MTAQWAKIKDSISNVIPEFHWNSGPSVFVTFKVQNTQITRITLAPSQAFGCTIQGSALQEEILAWVEAYLTGKEGQKLPLDFSLFTPFMQAGIESIRSIPFGEVATYGAVAKNTGNPHASRALGNVCHRNPYPLIIPCHRVIASNGSLGGFAYGLKMKQELLCFEALVSSSS